ncbi:MAG: ParA family protein [Gammaproteobacteria bacterium]|nr:ParA family protein [Gammaproteobacteria bacterium]MCP5137220.1 ParA family protein [Gammaproteobacteria bacterium]
MSERWAFLHQKGGTGKSTLAIASAQAMAARGRAVLILDVDYQGTASAWGERFSEAFNATVEGGVEVRSLVNADVAENLRRFAVVFDIIIVDAPPTLSALSDDILRSVDRVLVPTRPSWPDVWALATVAGLVVPATLSARVDVVFNQYQNEDLGALRNEIMEMGLNVLPDAVPRLGDFAELFHSGFAGPQAIAVVDRALTLP